MLSACGGSKFSGVLTPVVFFDRSRLPTAWTEHAIPRLTRPQRVVGTGSPAVSADRNAPAPAHASASASTHSSAHVRVRRHGRLSRTHAQPSSRKLPLYFTWKQAKPCHVGIHWKDLAKHSQMSTHLPGFRSFTLLQGFGGMGGSLVPTPRPSSRKLPFALLLQESLNNPSHLRVLSKTSNEYQHDRVLMVLKYLCILVLWEKVAKHWKG